MLGFALTMMLALGASGVHISFTTLIIVSVIAVAFDWRYNQ